MGEKPGRRLGTEGGGKSRGTAGTEPLRQPRGIGGVSAVPPAAPGVTVGGLRRKSVPEERLWVLSVGRPVP